MGDDDWFETFLILLIIGSSIYFTWYYLFRTSPTPGTTDTPTPGTTDTPTPTSDTTTLPPPPPSPDFNTTYDNIVNYTILNSNYNLSNNSWEMIFSINLSAGTYIMTTCCNFLSNDNSISANTLGLGISLDKNTKGCDNGNQVTINKKNLINTTLNYTRIHTSSENFTVYVQCFVSHKNNTWFISKSSFLNIIRL